MKYIKFKPELMFTGVAILKHAIIDYVMELKKDIWFSKNDLKWV